MSYPAAYDRVTFRGKTVDQRTKYLLELVEKALGYELTLLQGSYHPGVDQSGGTHDGGGVIDLAPYDAANKVKVLRRHGFAAWHRLPNQGDWAEHIHAVDCGNAKLSPSAQKQIDEYRHGENGLATHAADDGPHINLRAWAYPPLPYVSLANVAQQARTGGQRKLIGVQRVQRALNASGADLTVDGHFGAATKRAYAKYEQALGGDGDGIPAIFSLTNLGAGRFKVRKS